MLIFQLSRNCHTVSSSKTWHFSSCMWLDIYWHITMYLICIFLKDNEVEHLFICLIDKWVSSLGNCYLSFTQKVVEFSFLFICKSFYVSSCEILVLYPSILYFCLLSSLSFISLGICQSSKYILSCFSCPSRHFN